MASMLSITSVLMGNPAGWSSAPLGFGLKVASLLISARTRAVALGEGGMCRRGGAVLLTQLHSRGRKRKDQERSPRAGSCQHRVRRGYMFLKVLVACRSCFEG